ncbi:MAG: hypothetical protein GX070_04890 [Alcaligenaceae bacterium]|nr:hypothetical protein [Alcaligenaceae bacterium]
MALWGRALARGRGGCQSIWTGIGAVGAFIVGIALLGEQISIMRVIAAVMIVGGIVLMKLASDA